MPLCVKVAVCKESRGGTADGSVRRTVTVAHTVREVTTPPPTALSLCYLVQGPMDAPRSVLLGMKNLGFGGGKIVGLGGHIEAGEDAWDATCREVAEESGLVVERKDLVHRAEVFFSCPSDPSWDSLVSVFVANAWRGQLIASQEITPAWYATNELPLDLMWDDARYWLPRLMRSSDTLRARIAFDDSKRWVTSTDLSWATPPDQSAKYPSNPSSDPKY